MSNPLRAPKVDASTSVVSGAPSAYFEPGLEYTVRVSRGKNVEYMQQQLAGLDMGVENTFVIPKSLCVDAQVLAKVGPSLAMAKTGKPQFRVRTGPAYGLLSGIHAVLPAEGFGAQPRVGAAITDRYFVDAGTEMTLGRLRHAYPKVGSRPSRPVTASEARQSVANCGIVLQDMPGHVLRPYPLKPVDGSQAVTVNPKSDNGFPVLGKWETPGAADLCLELAVGIRKEIVQEFRTTGSVEGWKRRAEAERPYMVALRGKAKGDYYKGAKLEKGMMRFYNALPRQIMLNMQVATQPMEGLAQNILTTGHSGIGVSLAHGGAEELVSALERQLAAGGVAYVHVGDDSWMLIRERDELITLALDCSNFDLTQHSLVTAEVHRAIYQQLACIDAPAASLWYHFARERLVVVAGALVRRFYHAGPSGMPLQSKVNDVLMDVLIGRVLAAREAGKDEAWWDDLIQEVGRGMGFEVRVEQFARVSARTVRGLLEQVPFLFVGYYFHVREGRVSVFTDMPRTCAQMPYPGLKWMRTDRELLVMEAMRLGSMYMSSGVPPASLARAHTVWKEGVVELLKKAIAMYGDVSDDRLKWAVGESVFGPALRPSLSGLLAAVERPVETLWLEKEAELPGSSELVFPPSGAWADIAEEEEAADRKALGGYQTPAAAPLPKARFVQGERPPTHPTTTRNDGRMPPTARWAPDRAPRVRERRVHRRGRVVEEEDESEWSDEEYDDTESWFSYEY